MQERLTVADFYKPPSLTCAIEIEHLHKAFFVQEWLLVTTKDAPVILQQFSLKSKAKEKQYLLPFEGLAGVDMLGNTTVIFFASNEDLWVCSGQSVISLKSHFMPITALIAHRGNVYTGSADMTIRIWNPKKDSLLQDPKLHALSAHTGSVNFFLSVQQYLMSASSDKSVIVWRGTKIHTKKVFPTEVTLITECSESRQLAFLQKSGTISIVDSFLLAKEKRIEIKRVIDQNVKQPLVGLHEVDDSFLEMILPSSVVVAEINLGTVMAKTPLGDKLEVIRSRCLRRMTFLAVSMRGLYTLTF